MARALAQAGACRPPVEVLAAVDAALRAGLVQVGDIEAAVTTKRRRDLRWALQNADPRAESVLESALRCVLLRGGIRGIELQARVPAVGRVDLLVDGWLVLEADGFAAHSARAEYRSDRRRLAAAVVAGYVTLRFSWEDVVWTPDVVLQVVRAALVRRSSQAFRTAV